MSKGLLVFLVVCATAAAMVPRESPALVKSSPPPPPHTSTSGKREICAPQTPCAWSMYKPTIKQIEIRVPNNYCVCGPGLECKITEDDVSASAYVHRCRLPSDEEYGDS